MMPAVHTWGLDEKALVLQWYLYKDNHAIKDITSLMTLNESSKKDSSIAATVDTEHENGPVKVKETCADVSVNKRKTYTIEELKNPIDGVDWAKREDFLSDEDFKTHLGVSREEFHSMASWKRQNAKKKAGIF